MERIAFQKPVRRFERDRKLQLPLAVKGRSRLQGGAKLAVSFGGGASSVVRAPVGVEPRTCEEGIGRSLSEGPACETRAHRYPDAQEWQRAEEPPRTQQTVIYYINFLL